jgi:hypothetical protein
MASKQLSPKDAKPVRRKKSGTKPRVKSASALATSPGATEMILLAFEDVTGGRVAGKKPRGKEKDSAS